MEIQVINPIFLREEAKENHQIQSGKTRYF